MPPTIVNLTAYHGDTWAQTFRLKSGATPQTVAPVDLTGATVACWIRGSDGRTTPLTAQVTNAAGGEVTISGTPATGSYDYDLEVTQAGAVTTWIRGTLVVAGSITNG